MRQRDGVDGLDLIAIPRATGTEDAEIGVELDVRIDVVGRPTRGASTGSSFIGSIVSAQFPQLIGVAVSTGNPIGIQLVVRHIHAVQAPFDVVKFDRTRS